MATLSSALALVRASAVNLVDAALASCWLCLSCVRSDALGDWGCDEPGRANSWLRFRACKVRNLKALQEL